MASNHTITEFQHVGPNNYHYTVTNTTTSYVGRSSIRHGPPSCNRILCLFLPQRQSKRLPPRGLLRGATEAESN